MTATMTKNGPTPTSVLDGSQEAEYRLANYRGLRGVVRWVLPSDYLLPYNHKP